ncbi:MAG: ABC transporter ATP-binding protein [Actinomycetes bacterium]
MKSQDQILLSVRNLVKNFELRANSGLRKTKRIVQAVSDVSFDVHVGQTLGLVGESGSGKTTVGRSVLQLIQPTSGEVIFEGQDLTKMSFEQLREVRRQMQIVFQDPFASLDPKMTVGSSIAEPLVVQGVQGNHHDKVAELLDLVGLASDHAKRFPHEFSGGQRQRIGIARALALDPKLIVLDEPVSALDVSIQAGVVNLFSDLQKRLGMSYIFIAHDLSVVRHIADQVAVMYLGKIVEIGDKDAVYRRPSHPYTKALLSAVPLPDPKVERTRSRIMLEGDVPSPVNPPTGCRFRTRCWKATDLCAAEEPQLVIRSSGQQSACHHPE